MPSYQYRDSYYKDKTVSWWSYLYSGNPHSWKGGLYIEVGPWWANRCRVVKSCIFTHLILVMPHDIIDLGHQNHVAWSLPSHYQWWHIINKTFCRTPIWTFSQCIKVFYKYFINILFLKWNGMFPCLWCKGLVYDEYVNHNSSCCFWNAKHFIPQWVNMVLFIMDVPSSLCMHEVTVMQLSA